ncbi:insulin receptor substrate 2-B-like [Archocentrus centrarchus]|uniref:insulin receptor substrate 2-B-like n=1 Tax=Archocentrus centrarchus TaxID=63155 RepID=UPI0011E9C921|nr:insulin receptor substrate 2-B-like [Archocentrus centrarchus]XP_030610186.1 insulin receptor substrate 2-B-like [Archocentrus centrarchus]XP_030610194.1 insulin receptor substrate 2-B-like [Archocentrus centrarchus]
MAEGRDGCADQRKSPLASCSPLPCHRSSSTQTWLSVETPLWNDSQTEQDEASGNLQSSERPSPLFYEELFCAGRTSIPLAPLAPLACALLASSGPQSDVVKQGYLGKLERNHRRYFVLRAGSHTGPSRLEWYKSQEKFTAKEKSSGKATLFGSNKQGVIYLRRCLGVSRIASSRKGHIVALYPKDQTMVLVMEDQQEQEDWYVALKKLMEEEQKDEEHGEGGDEEDDGYCTLPSAAFFKEVWPVTVKPRGLGSSKALTGENRLCLTAASLILVRVGAGNDLPSVTIPLLSVRRFGHLDGSFYLELGRSAPNGPGEIWMEVNDQGNRVLAQHIHEAVREAVQALRVLPDLSSSPISSHSQTQGLLASKRCRPKYSNKLVNVRSQRPLALFPKSPDIQTSPTQAYVKPLEPDKTNLELSSSSSFNFSPSRSQQSSMSETCSYMEMKMDHCSAAACGMQGLQPAEDKEELGYMIMSPQVSRSSSVLARDDYVTMTSPHKNEQAAYSSFSSFLQTSFNSSSSDSYSPLHPSHQTNECSQPHWLMTSAQQSEMDADQSQMLICCSIGPHDDVKQEEGVTSPLGSIDGSDLMIPFVTFGSGCTRPIQASSNMDADQSSQFKAVPDRSSLRRCWMSLFLPVCLQAEDTS